MTQTSDTIGSATDVDIDGILALQRANQVAHGGMLVAELPRTRIALMMREMPLIVAKQDSRITGFLMTSTRAMNAELPVIRAMFAAYPGTEDTYVYGPDCVDLAERGKGLAGAMFSALRHLSPGREGVLFIRKDNAASLRAHRHMGMREVADFSIGDAEFVVFSYIG